MIDLFQIAQRWFVSMNFKRASNRQDATPSPSVPLPQRGEGSQNAYSERSQNAKSDEQDRENDEPKCEKLWSQNSQREINECAPSEISQNAQNAAAPITKTTLSRNENLACDQWGQQTRFRNCIQL